MPKENREVMVREGQSFGAKKKNYRNYNPFRTERQKGPVGNSPVRLEPNDLASFILQPLTTNAEVPVFAESRFQENCG